MNTRLMNDELVKCPLCGACIESDETFTCGTIIVGAENGLSRLKSIGVECHINTALQIRDEIASVKLDNISLKEQISKMRAGSSRYA